MNMKKMVSIMLSLVCVSSLSLAAFAEDDDAEIIEAVETVITKAVCCHPVVHDVVTTIASTTADTIFEVASAVGEIGRAVGNAVKKGIEYQASHPSDPSNPWNID